MCTSLNEYKGGPSKEKLAREKTMHGAYIFNVIMSVSCIHQEVIIMYQRVNHLLSLHYVPDIT